MNAHRRIRPLAFARPTIAAAAAITHAGAGFSRPDTPR